jgi:hypothetical protein
MSKPIFVKRARAKLLDAVREAELTVKDALRKAELSGKPAPADAIAKVQPRLAELHARAAVAPPDELASLREEAEDVSRLRAFLLPETSLATEAETALSELEDWGVPDATLKKLRTGDGKYDRDRLIQIYEEYDFWNGYIGWYFGVMGWIYVFCLAVFTAGMVVAYRTLVDGSWVYLCAGASGTVLSIMSKRPKLSAYGETTDFIFRTAARFASGVAATAIGFGLLSLGIVNISPKGEPSQLAMIAVAILFGFSERAISSFEDAIFAVKPKPETGK